MEFEADTSRGPGTHFTSKSVLLVEDNVLIEPIWRLIINQVDQHATLDWVISEGAAQRSIWKKKSEGAAYDLIISDIFISGCKTGIDLWKENRSEKMAFIFTSAVPAAKFAKLFSDEKERPPFVSKPLDPMACISTINAVLFSKAIQKQYG